MIKWLDSLDREWGISFAPSLNGKYIDMTTYPPKGNYGNTIQISIEAFKELRLMLCDLKVGENDSNKR